MIKIEWKSHWPSIIGGFNSDYYYALWDKEGIRPYLDINYWIQFNRWFEETYNCKIIETIKVDINGESNKIKSHLEFENESDATMFLLRWK